MGERLIADVTEQAPWAAARQRLRVQGFTFVTCRGCAHELAVPERLVYAVDGYVHCPHCGSRMPARGAHAEA